jgi:ubiquitin-conjugating enzyme E2 variant
VAALIAFVVLGSRTLVRVCHATHPAVRHRLPLALFAGFLAADLASGVVHWFCDAWADPRWPMVGPALIRTFREHHSDASAIVRHDFAETNGATALIALLPLGIAQALPTEPGHTWATLLAAFLGALAGFVACTGQFHKWAHHPRPPGLVRLLQRARLVLSPEHHARHHVPPFDRHFCITSGWLDPVLEHLGLFRRLDRLIQAALRRSAR